VLSLIAAKPSITALELARRIDITERAVRRIISDLENEGYIEKDKDGRRVRYRINSHAPLRHITQRDKAVGLLLRVIESGGAEAEIKESLQSSGTP